MSSPNRSTCDEAVTIHFIYIAINFPITVQVTNGTEWRGHEDGKTVIIHTLIPPKRTSTSETPAITLDAIRQLTADFTAALEAQTAAMASASNLAGTPAVKTGNYKEYAEESKVTFATVTLTDDALSWWNAYAQPMGIEQANGTTWTELKSLLTNKYCPRTEIRKMEEELYNLSVKGNNLKPYVRRFQ
ncbi:reverse transcriptase domain-containing protein [Tanacetum coccineum]